MFKGNPGRKAVRIFLAVSFLIVPLAPACIWDKDTIAMENARFPDVIDIISGNFPRHSREFHEWRIIRTKADLIKTPGEATLYDDLAVSQHKLGDHAAAIETMNAKEAIRPGLYETYSNMGTFLIYAGDLPKSLDFINKALSLNPEAHFGREKYQKWLVEWVIAGKPTLNERPGPDDHMGLTSSGYAAFILSKQPVTERNAMTEPLRKQALQGVLGMMRFADFDNPLLQEALGDLLSPGKADSNATYLASLAYLHASQNATNPEDKAQLARKLSIASSTLLKLNASARAGSEKILEGQLQAILKRGETLSSTVRKDELAWIEAGKDVSAEFTRKYLQP
ncbi:MAG: hypothetical protein EOP84_25770 [Verrucomicrobiaceae bacterium]|nr:MAG: hypothetical protein EOP84_25770 [Verrucomicrobiaceae bacterium]